MTEINPKSIKIRQTHTGDPANKSQKSNSLKNGDFDKILNNQFDKSLKTSDIKGTPALPELQGSFRAQALNFKLDRTQFTHKLEASLSLLESYAAWLEDPQKSLKQAHGLLEQLLDQTRSLEHEFNSFESSDSSHPDLAQMLSQLQTTLQVEQIKFDRGDYTN